MLSSIGPNFERSIRLLLGAVGGYAFAYGVIAFGGSAMARMGMFRGEAVVLSYLIALPLYVAVITWAAATPKLWRTSFLIVGCSAVLIGASTYVVSP